MSVEGMWKFQSGSLDAPTDIRWGGIVVLETGRVFGGDSAMAYLGNYETDRGKIAAQVRSWVWNTDLPEEELANVFGMTGEIDYEVVIEGTLEGQEIKGFLWPKGADNLRLPARMVKIADLP